jgi:predicted dehydrogenase
MNPKRKESDKILRVGVIGAGTIATGVHIPVLSNIPDIEISWIADKNRNRADMLGSIYGIPGFGEELLRESLPPTDVLVFAIPIGARAPYYDRFAHEGAAWYVEKPFARTGTQHEELCDLRPDYALACGLQRRACGVVRLAKQIVSDRLFGYPSRVEMGLGRRGRILGGGTFLTDPLLAGGGFLAEVGIHCIDAVLFCLGCQDFEILSSRMIVDQGMDLHTCATVKVHDDNGRAIEFDFTVSNLEDTTETIVIYCDHAQISFSIFSEPELSVASVQGKRVFRLADRNQLYPCTSDQIFHTFWCEFLRGLRSRTANYTAARASTITTKLIEALYLRSTEPRGATLLSS